MVDVHSPVVLSFSALIMPIKLFAVENIAKLLYWFLLLDAIKSREG